MSRSKQLARGALARLPPGVKQRMYDEAVRLGALDLADRDVQVAPDRVGAVTERLYERLSPATRSLIPDQISGEEATLWARADEGERKRLTLALGVHLGLPEVLRETGLRSDMPSEGVHTMVRGAVHAGGAYDAADMVVEGLARAGAVLESGQSGLDFGCSSGRVVRALAAAFPDVRWCGREPNVGAIEWAQQHLPEIDFAVSADNPPLDFSDQQLEFAFAISVWSHFAEAGALRWLAEMHRIIRPGGHLVLTTHGYNSLRFMAAHQLRAPEWLRDAYEGLYRRGYWFYDEFRGRGDDGIENPEWGTCFFSLEWLCANAMPEWRLAHYAVGRALGNQDLIVLARP